MRLASRRGLSETRGPNGLSSRTVDAEGEVLDVLVQFKRNKHAPLELLCKLLKRGAFAPERLVTGDLRSYSAPGWTALGANAGMNVRARSLRRPCAGSCGIEQTAGPTRQAAGRTPEFGRMRAFFCVPPKFASLVPEYDRDQLRRLIPRYRILGFAGEFVPVRRPAPASGKRVRGTQQGVERTRRNP